MIRNPFHITILCTLSLAGFLRKNKNRIRVVLSLLIISVVMGDSAAFSLAPESIFKGAESSTVRVVTCRRHDQVLEHLRALRNKLGHPISVLVNFDAHDDVGMSWQRYLLSGGEGTWVWDALREGLVETYVCIPPRQENLRHQTPRVWRVERSWWWPRPRVVQVHRYHLPAALKAMEGKQAVVTVDADAYSLRELGQDLYHTPPENFSESSQPLVGFLRAHSLKPHVEVFFSTSAGGGVDNRWIGERADDAYLRALEKHLGQAVGALVPAHFQNTAEPVSGQLNTFQEFRTAAETSL